LPLLPEIRFVVLEQLSLGLETLKQQSGFQDDFFSMEKIVSDFNSENINTSDQCNLFYPGFNNITSELPVEDEILFGQQQELTRILEESKTYGSLLANLHQSSLMNTDWKLESWDPDMLDTAMKIARKWKQGMAGLKK
jgi:hypothetical protein